MNFGVMTRSRKTMEDITLDRAVEVARALAPEEQLKLRSIMDSWQTETPTETTPDQQRRLAEHLLADGLLEHILQNAYTDARSSGT